MNKRFALWESGRRSGSYR